MVHFYLQLKFHLAQLNMVGLLTRYTNYFLIFIAALLVTLIYFVLQKTELGLKARATMQNPEIASTIGINKKKCFL